MSVKTLIVSMLCLAVHYGASTLEAAQAQGDAPPKGASKGTTTQSQAQVAVKIIKRGEELPKGEYLSLDDVAAQPERFADKAVLLTGKVDSVCRVKGCWMIIASEKSKANARITFKDYAFFVPRDARGMKTKMSGVIKMKTLSEGERQHLADDGKVDISEIPKVELRLVADGVELYPQG